MKNPLLLILVLGLVLLLQISPLFAYSRIDCTFDSSACSYTQTNGNSWMRTNNATVNPGHDHTSGTGYWLSTIPSSNYSGTQEFSVLSPYVYSTSGPSCLRFWYVFFGLEKAQFDVKINHQQNTFNAQMLWSKLTPQSNNWIQGYVDIPRQSSYFYVIWHATLTSKYHDTVGIDDVTLSPGACPPSPLVDFESGMGSWTSQGAALTNGTPINDHTAQTSLGHYLLNKGASQTSVISASMKNLTSTYTNNFYRYCFKLWYYFLFQPSAGDTQSYIFLNITNYRYQYNKKLTVQDAYNDGLYNKWEPFYFTIPNPKRMTPYLVDPHKDPILTITLYGKGTTQIAVDDLLVSDDACEDSGDCDFEKDFCGWSNVGNYLWLRSTGGNTKALSKSPPIDTTTKTAAGWYAVFPLEYIRAYDTAVIQSPPLSSRSQYNCFSFFYWAVTPSEAYPVAAFYVNFYDLTKFNQRIARVAVNASTFPMWQRFHFSMPKLPLRYSISISTAFSSGRLTSDLAIDDIVLSDSSCRNDRPGMVSTTPIPYNERIWDCSFEYKCRQWSFDNNWKMTSYRKLPPSVPAPRSDHNQKTPEGGYLLFMPPISAQNMTTTTSVLNSTIITDKQHCLSFWYYDSSEIFFTLTVYLRTTTHTVILRTVRPNIASRSWKAVKVDTWPYYNSQFLSLSLLTTNAANGSFAIDDIKLTPGACQHIDDYVYTFDSIDNLEITRVSPLNGFMGTIRFQGDRTYPSAPTRDHTTGTGGYFLFMNRQTDFNTTYTDLLVVDNLPAMRFRPELSSSRCFRFAYQVKGDATLKVYLSQVNSNSYYYPLFSTYADHTNWVVAQVPYSAYYEHKLVFIMTKQWDATSYVALDDLSISSHNCKRAVECDFDDDVCAYSSSYYKSDYDFSRYVGPPSNASWPGPPYDHTKRGYGGGYLSMTGFPSTRDRTRTSLVQTPIEAFPYTVSTNYCLSFWLTLTANDAAFTITLNLFGKTASGAPTSKGTTLVTISNTTQNKWTHYAMDIDRKMFAAYHEFSLSFSGLTKKANTVIAVDDIAMAHTSCDYGFRFKCADGTVIDADKLCNFKYDCPGNDHSDEANCGACDFENGFCGWLNDYRRGEYSSQGRWYVAKANSGQIGPKTDGNGNANGHYLYLSSYLAKLFVAGTKLTRNYGDFKLQFKDAYLTCSMTFDYYLYSNRTQYSGAALEINAGSDTDSAVLKAYYTANKANSWQKGIVYLGGFPGSFVVTFLGSRFVANESVALDNIQFHNCSFPNPIAPKASCPASAEVMCSDSRICIDPSDLCDFEDDCGTNWDERWSLCSPAVNPKIPPSCAFEQSLEFCGFTMETSEKLFNWQFTKGYDYNLMGYSGPGADHTTKDRSGQYLMLKSYNKKYLNKNIRLYSPFMYSKGGACWLRFFYYNNGNLTLNSYNSLKVWVQYADGNNDDSGTLFRSNSYMAYWQKGKVKFSSGSPFRFVFDSQLADTRGSISLDDVSFSMNCVYSPNSKLTPGSHSHAAVTVILVLLALAIVGGVGFFLYRKHKSGELTTYVDRVSSMMPGKKSSQVSHVVNVNYKDGPSTSTAAE